MPPSRYRVVEQGRRLVVIDTLSGEPASRPTPARTPERRAELRSQAPASRYAGSPTLAFTTQNWFDAQGPRTLQIGQTGQGQLALAAMGVLFAGVILWLIFGWPLLVVLAFAIAQPKARTAMRAGLTEWLTAIDETEA